MATKWFPDTCTCEIDIEGEQFTLVTPCPHHQTAEDVLAENRVKNVEVVNPLITEFGNGEILPKGKTVEWERNEKGTLDYKLVGFTEQEKILAATLVTSEDITLKDELDIVLKEAVVKEETEVIKGG